MILIFFLGACTSTFNNKLPKSNKDTENSSNDVGRLTGPLNNAEYINPKHRIALVIGNGSYNDGLLSDPLNDVLLITNVLSNKLGFDVTKEVDVNQKEMRQLIKKFGKRLKSEKDSVGLFYYSGHGMQVNGINYMIPIDEEIEEEDDVEIHGVRIRDVLLKMKVADNAINLVFLDACRNNPFEKSFKSLAKGLVRPSSPQGTLIAFAAQPHKVALQGVGKYSYFTDALVQEIDKPGVSLDDMLRNVRRNVFNKTNKRQFPEVVDQTFIKFYFIPPSKPSADLKSWIYIGTFLGAALSAFFGQ